MTDMEYTLDERVIRKPTHDTPEAALAAALEFIDVRYQGIFSSASGPGPTELAAAILAAMPDWTLVPRVATADWTGSTKCADADAERLANALGLYVRLPAEFTGIIDLAVTLIAALAAVQSEP